MSIQTTFPWHQYTRRSEAEHNVVTPLRGAVSRYPGDPGEVFGYGCQECGAFWKTYQKEYHNAGCSRERHVECNSVPV